jgi:RNA polymerase sigma-70 factor (ECF subfamily)
MRESALATMNPDVHPEGQVLPPTFEELFAAYQPLVYNICLKFTGSPQDAEDAAQEVFTKIWKNLDDFQHQSSLRTWIYRISMNTCIDSSRRPWRRLIRRNTTLEDLLDQGDQGPIVSESESAEHQLLAKEKAEELRRAITSLKPRLRAVLILKDLEELSYEEISAVLGIGLGTISSRLNRARKALQERLQAAGSAPARQE